MLSTKDFFELVGKSGLQRTNRYQVMVAIPQAVVANLNKQVTEFGTSANMGSRLLGISNAPERTLSLMATTVLIPGYNVNASEMKVGNTRRIANSVNYGEFTIIFRCTGEMVEKKIFDAWRKTVQGPDHSVGFYDSYIGNIKVFAMDQNDNVTYETSMSEAYPLTVTELSFNREERDAFATISVTFTFRKLYNLDEDNSERRKASPVNYPNSNDARFARQDRSIDIDDLPRAPNRATEFPQLFLPDPPPNQNRPLYLQDVYTSIERVKVRIEDGTLDPALGTKMLRGMTSSIEQDFDTSEDVNNVINYVDNMIQSLGGRR